jgi:hypothetical protein
MKLPVPRRSCWSRGRLRPQFAPGGPWATPLRQLNQLAGEKVMERAQDTVVALT